MSSKHLIALEALFNSVEEEIGPSAGPKTCEALGNAKEVIDSSHKEEKEKDQ